MMNEISNVRYVQEVDSTIWTGDASNRVNDYLQHEEWILLNTAVTASVGDDGAYTSIKYAVGWIGAGEPQIPPAHQPPGS